MMLEQFTSHEKAKLLAALLLGTALGFAANYTLHPKIKQQPNALAEMRSGITFGTVTESVKHCTVMEAAPLYSEPSTLSGHLLRTLPKGMQVEYLTTVPSLDQDSSKAAAAYDLEYKKLLFQTVYIPKGTPFTIKSETAGQYYCSFELNGKRYIKHFEKQLVIRAYTQSWQQVQIGSDTGFIPATLVSEPKY